MAMTEFRPCPSHDGYEVNVHGVVRRAEYVRHCAKGDIVQQSKVLKRVGRKLEYVNLKGTWVKAVALVEEAWAITIADDGQPASSYPDGRVITVHEWAEIKRVSSCRV
jgi:hypothetical protein